MNPCYKCEKRHTRCHVDCSDYERFKAEREAQNIASQAKAREAYELWSVKNRIRKIAEKDEK